MSGYGDIAAYAGSDMSLSEPGKPAEMAEGLRASANLFSILGSDARARPRFPCPTKRCPATSGSSSSATATGRIASGATPASSDAWSASTGRPYEIVGVLPATFSDWRHLGSVDVFRPLVLDDKERRDRSSTQIRLVGRRSATVSRAAGRTPSSPAFGRRLAHDFPAANAESAWTTVPIDDSFLGKDAQPILAMLVGLSGFVVLIACSNLANLLLARTMARSREFAVRSALGASRSQMLRPLVAESLLLAFAGGVLAVYVALWTYDWFAVVSAGDNGVGVDVHASTGTSSPGRSPRASSRHSPSAWPPRSSPCAST